MLTTLRQEPDGWYIDVTETEDGRTDIIVGPTPDKEQAQRWERHILREHGMWGYMIRSQSPKMFDACMRKMRACCTLHKPLDHNTWMRAHPFPKPPLVLSGGAMMTIPMDRRSNGDEQ